MLEHKNNKTKETKQHNFRKHELLVFSMINSVVNP